jgi:membrane-bound lytic murein transglycosylase A
MSGTRLVPGSFDAIRGWIDDDHALAFAAFLSACPALLAGAPPASDRPPADPALLTICAKALRLGHRKLAATQARLFFERFFLPHTVEHASSHGLLTGYYEPIVEGSRTPGGRYRVPLYRRPPDLVNVVVESERARPDIAYTHMRQTAAGLSPYPTRSEIESGTLAGHDLELIWLADPVDAFFAQVQGSLRVRLPDGAQIGLTYDGKNGQPYTSIGRILVERGEIPLAEMSLERLGGWLRADEARGRELMQHNASYVFFRETDGASAIGALGAPLVPGRSLAVDTAHVALGLPVFVDAPTLRHWGRRGPFRRLMMAHDVGSAIRGPERGDIYFGAGPLAGARAGITKHPGNFHVLLPRAAATGRGAS